MTFDTFLPLTPSVGGDPKTAVEPPRSSFHTQPQNTGKRFAAANGFAKSVRLFPCGNGSGKGCSGKLSPSREGRAAKEQVCQPVTLSVVQAAKPLELPEYGENAIRKIVVAYLEASQELRSSSV